MQLPLPDLTPLIYSIVGGSIVAAISLLFIIIREWYSKRSHKVKVKELVVEELNNTLNVLNQLIATKRTEEQHSFQIIETKSFYHSIPFNLSLQDVSVGVFETQVLTMLKQIFRTMQRFNNSIRVISGSGSQPEIKYAHIEPAETLAKEIAETLRLLDECVSAE